MAWADKHIESLKNGETIKFRPRGNSMQGKIESGQLCTLIPINLEDIQKNDIVLCKVNGRQYLHLVKSIKNNRFLIANNKGHENGWTSQIFGKCIQVED